MFTYRPENEWSSNSLLFLVGFLVSRLRNDFGNCAARRAEFDRHDSWITDNFAAQFVDLRHRLVKIFNLNGKVMNAGSGSRGQRFCGFLAIIFDQRQVDGAVAQMTRGVVPDFAGL